MLRVSVEGSTRNRMIRYLQQSHENHISIEIVRQQDPELLVVWARHAHSSVEIGHGECSCLENGYKVALVMCLYKILEHYAEIFRKQELQQKLDEVKEHAA